MADLRISELPDISADQLEGADRLPLADMSASQSKSATLQALTMAGVRSLPPQAITPSQIDWTMATGAEPWPTLPVHGDEIADNATLITSAAGGQFIGQLKVDLSNQMSYWTGTSWQGVYGGVGSLSIAASAPLNGLAVPSGVTPGQWDVNLSLSGTTGAREFLAGPTTQSGAVAYRPIVPDDLPKATPTSAGIVSVPGNGISIVNGALAIDHSVTPQLVTYCAVTYNEYGLVVDGRALAPGDMPVAAAGSPGAVFPGPELSVSPSGELTHIQQVQPGVAAKVVFNNTGHIVGVETLVPADIPPLDASKITTGALSTDRIADNSITLDKLADYSNAYIQSDQPNVAGIPIGTLWLSPLAQQIRMWDGNVWQPIGFGSLSEENLRLGGLFDADTGLITSVSEFGANLNLAPGGVIPAATSAFAGLYFVNQTAGSGVAVTPGISYAVGDWVLCISAAEGWKKIAAGGGGGGGATGVTQVTGTAPIQVVNGTTAPAISIASATGSVAGSMSAADKAKLDGIEAGAQVNVQADWNAVSGPSAILNKPSGTGTGSVPAATTTVAGIVRLATAADITGGATDAVPTAAQLKSSTPGATTTAPGLVQLATNANVDGAVAGRVVDAAQLKGVRDLIVKPDWNAAESAPNGILNKPADLGGTPADATTTVKGIVRLATQGDIDSSSTSAVPTAAQLKAVSDATANVKPDWNAASSAASGILNKPTIPTVVSATTSVEGIVRLAAAADVTNGVAGRVVDAQQLRDRTQDASTIVKGIVQLSEDYKFPSPATTRAPNMKALQDVWLDGNRQAIDVTSASPVAPGGIKNVCGVIKPGVTKLTFDPSQIPDGAEFNYYNDSGVIVDIVVAGRGFIHRVSTGYVVATDASPAKLQVNGLLNVWFVGGAGGFAFARGLS